MLSILKKSESGKQFLEKCRNVWNTCITRRKKIKFYSVQELRIYEVTL